MDTPDVMALTRDIWDGNDYVPLVWEEWLADPHGILAVAESGGHVVGLVKLSWKGYDEWWLQGLRVHPQHQGEGIASHMHNYVLDYWQRNLGGVLRLATSSERFPVHHLCQRTGFSKAGEYRLYVAPALNDQPHAFCPVQAGVAEDVLDRARGYPIWSISHGLIYLDWYWGETTIKRLEDTIRNGQAYWWSGERHSAKGLLFTAIDDDDEQGEHPYVQLLGCEIGDLPEMLVDYRRLAGEAGFQRAEWLAPDQEIILPALEQAGYLSEWESTLYLFEKRHSP